MPTDLLHYKDLFRKYGQFNHFQIKTLIQMANFMSIRPVTGLNTINNILRLVRLPAIPVDAPLVRHMAKMLVVREMNMLFSQLRAEDVHIDFEGVNAFNET